MARRRPSQRRAGWGCVATGMRAAYSRPADRQRQSKCSRWMRRFGTPCRVAARSGSCAACPRAAHEDRQLAAVAVGGGEHALGGQAPLHAGVDQMGVQRRVAVGDGADLLGERRLAVRAVEEVDAMGQLVTVEGAQPAQERRDADAAGDPHLPIGSLPMAEAPVRTADDRRHARLDELLQSRRVVAQRLDRDAHDVLVRGAGDRERVSVPAVLGLDVDHGELAGDELHVPADRAHRDLDHPFVDLAHGLHLVVVQREEEARQQLAVDVEAQPDGADRDVAPAQERRAVERRPVEHAVHEARGDEEPGRAVQRSPALVAAEDPASLAHTRRVARGDHEAAQRPRHHRLPARQDRPQRERDHADRPDRTQRSAERGAVRVRGQQDVRRQQDQAGDRDAAMPDRGTVDPVEPLLDPGQRADEHQPDRQQQDRLGAQQLPDVAPGGLARRAARRSTGGPEPRRGRRSSSARPRGRRTSRAVRAPRHGSAGRPPRRVTTGGSRCPSGARPPRAPPRARRPEAARRRASRPARRSRTSR